VEQHGALSWWAGTVGDKEQISSMDPRVCPSIVVVISMSLTAGIIKCSAFHLKQTQKRTLAVSIEERNIYLRVRVTRKPLLVVVANVPSVVVEENKRLGREKERKREKMG
jgi:hypothetical protein